MSCSAWLPKIVSVYQQTFHPSIKPVSLKQRSWSTLAWEREKWCGWHGVWLNESGPQLLVAVLWDFVSSGAKDNSSYILFDNRITCAIFQQKFRLVNIAGVAFGARLRDADPSKRVEVLVAVLWEDTRVDCLGLWWSGITGSRFQQKQDPMPVGNNRERDFLLFGVWQGTYIEMQEWVFHIGRPWEVSPGAALVSREGLSRLSLVQKNTLLQKCLIRRIHHPSVSTLAGRPGMDVSPLCMSLL